MALTEYVCKTIKPAEKTTRITDEKGLYLEISTTGGKYWRFKYRFSGKEKRLSIGVYPEVTLKVARAKRDEARLDLRNGIDPSSKKKASKLEHLKQSTNSFEAVALDWHEKQKGIWTPKHSDKTLRRLKRDIFPRLGHLPITNVTATAILEVIRKIEEKDTIDLAHRTLQTISQILRFAIATARTERNVATDLRGALKPLKKKSYACLKNEELKPFIEKLEEYDGDAQTRNATKLLLLTFVRTIELRAARWAEIDWEKAEWRIPGERMKMRQMHIVPLSLQALELFKTQQKVSGNREFVFPNRTRPHTFISENTILYAIYRMGFHNRTTAHGFRATASTILNENGFRGDVIERQLAHGERNLVRASYNHAQYLMERREMMQWWGDYLSNAGLEIKSKAGHAPGR